MKTFVDLVREYSAWKLTEKGNGKLTKDELANLREQFRAQGGKTSNNSQLKERVNEYRKWKKANKGTDKLTEKELQRIKESLKPAKTENGIDVYISNYKKFKEAVEGPGAKITYKEIKMLKENFNEATQNGIRLREADAGFDPAAMGGAPMAGDPNAMAGGMDPNAMGADPNAMAGGMDPAADPMAMQGAIEQAAAALQPFTQAGANPMGADPMAGQPPVDGMPPDPAMAGGDPAAMGGAPMMEMINNYKQWKQENKGTSKLTEAEFTMLKEEAAKRAPKQKLSKYEEIKSRIAERQAKIAALQEGFLDIPSTAEMGTLTTKATPSNSDNPDNATSPDPIPVPSPQQLAGGYSSGRAAGETKPGKTWPTKATGKEAGGALQGAGATQTKVKESVKTVTDVYVEQFMEPKLNFDSIKNSMKKGLLG